MRPVKIKLCGMFRPQDIDAVNLAKPDYCGFVIDVPGSRRSISPQQAEEFRQRLHPGIVSVGVFVNAPPQLVAELLNRNVLGMAQLHGQEDSTYLEQLKVLTPKPLIQAFSVRTAEDVNRAVSSPADLVLLDNGSGGTGQAFDWDLIRQFPRPFFLAGGLSPERIPSALRLGPYGVDLSSGIETNGVKDPQKMIDAVRNISC